MSKHVRIALLLSALLVAIVTVYRPGLIGPFVFDDYPNIVENAALAVTALDLASLRNVVSDNPTGLSRPIAMLSFALNRYYAGPNDAYWFKVTNLAIHLLNTVLVFWLVHLLTTQYRYRNRGSISAEYALWLPIVTTAIWALHPLNVTSVLYVVQRMTSLASLCMLVGLICFVTGRRLFERSPRRAFALMIVGTLGGTVLGTLAKEIALLLPLYLLIVDYTFFRGERRWPAAIRRFHAISIGILLVITTYYLIHRYNIFANYDVRMFTIGERLLTETRVLWFYISLILFPVPGRFSLFHDDIALSTSLLSPWTTMVAVISLVAVVSIAIRTHRRLPIVAFAVFWFLAGHAMESTIVGLEIAHEHRNYLPSLGPLMAIAISLGSSDFHRTNPAVVAGLAALALVIIGFSTFVRASEWASDETLIRTMAIHHPKSPRTMTMLADLHAIRHRDPIAAILYYQKAITLAPDDAGIRIRFAMLTADPSFTKVLSTKQYGARTLQTDFIGDVTRLLTQLPVSPDTYETLKRFGNCVVEPPHPCANLADPAIEWYLAVINNRTAGVSLRRDATIALFNIAIQRRNYSKALQAADLGKQQEPGNPAYDLMRANALILSRRFSEAELLLQSIRSRDDQTADIRYDLALLQAALEQRRPASRIRTPQ